MATTNSSTVEWWQSTQFILTSILVLMILLLIATGAIICPFCFMKRYNRKSTMDNSMEDALMSYRFTDPIIKKSLTIYQTKSKSIQLRPKSKSGVIYLSKSVLQYKSKLLKSIKASPMPKLNISMKNRVLKGKFKSKFEFAN